MMFGNHKANKENNESRGSAEVRFGLNSLCYALLSNVALGKTGPSTKGHFLHLQVAEWQKGKGRKNNVK